MEWKSPSFLRALGRSVAQKVKIITIYLQIKLFHSYQVLLNEKKQSIYIYTYVWLTYVFFASVAWYSPGAATELRLSGKVAAPLMPPVTQLTFRCHLLPGWGQFTRIKTSEFLARKFLEVPGGHKATHKRFLTVKKWLQKWNTSDVPVNIIICQHVLYNYNFHNKTRRIRGLSMSYLTYLSNLNKCLNINI